MKGRLRAPQGSPGASQRSSGASSNRTSDFAMMSGPDRISTNGVEQQVLFGRGLRRSTNTPEWGRRRGGRATERITHRSEEGSSIRAQDCTICSRSRQRGQAAFRAACRPSKGCRPCRRSHSAPCRASAVSTAGPAELAVRTEPTPAWHASCGGASVVLLGCVPGPGMKLQGGDAPSRALGCRERQCVTGGSSAREAIS